MKAFERIWISVNFHENSIFEIFSNILKIKNLKIFIFSFSIKLRSVVSLRVFEIWQWSNNEKVSIFIEEYDFHIFIGARALPRALRATLYTPKLWILATFQSTWCCARTRRAREILARANGYRMKNWIFFVFTMYSYLQNSQRWKHLKFSKFGHEIAFRGQIPEIGAAHL